MRKAAPVRERPLSATSPEGRFEVRDQPPSASSVNDQDAGLLNVGQLQVSLFEADPLVLVRTAPAALAPTPELPDEEEDEDEEGGAETSPDLSPIADAGSPRTFTSPEDGVLDASASRQLDGERMLDRTATGSLQYDWSVASRPPGQTSDPVIDDQDGRQTTFGTRGLAEGTYTFQVLVTNDDGLTDVDRVAHRVSATQAALASPANLRATERSDDSITVEWDPATDVDSYQIRWQIVAEPGEDSFRHLPFGNQNSGLSSRVRSFTVSGLNSDTNYEVQVRSVRDGSFSAPPAQVESRTVAQDSDVNPVRNIRVDGISTSTAQITWGAPSTANSAPTPTGYRWEALKLLTPGRELRMSGARVTSTTLVASLRSLETNKRYRVRVFALYGSRESRPATVNFRTNDVARAAQPGIVTNLRTVSAPKATSMHLAWTFPTGGTPVSHVYWTLRLADSPGTLVRQGKRYGTTYNTAYFSGLRPNTRYRLTVAAANADDVRGQFESRVFTTAGTTPAPARPAAISQGTLSVSFTATARLVFSAIIGQATATATGGVPPYSYAWTGTTPVSGQTVRFYGTGRTRAVSVTVTDSAGTTATSRRTVTP